MEVIILGLPGEVIQVRGGTLCVNDSPLLEPYFAIMDSSDIGPGKIEANHFVVGGDNRQPTLMFVVSQDRIVGRLMFPRTLRWSACRPSEATAGSS